MMDILFEQHVAQNTGLAAEAIWQTVQSAHEAKGRAEGVPLALAFLVLPLTFHERTAKSLASKTQPGSLYKALADDREIVVGLQTRMEALSDRTLQALSIGFHTGLLLLDPNEERQLLPGRKSPPIAHATQEVKTILNAAKRVGQAFSEMTIVQLATHLGIRF
jgi:hypothetical protein